MAFPTEEELRKMTVKQLRQHIKEMNDHYAIRGYYKMNKDQLINSIGTAHLRIGKGEAGHPAAHSAKPKKSMPKGKSILESKLKQKRGRPAKTSTEVKKRLY